NHSESASRVSSGRSSMRPDHVPFGKRERRRSWARSHAGRASCSLAAPASVRRTSFSRRSCPERMATQPASIRGRRLRVSVVSSRDVSPPRSRWRTSPAARRRRRSEYWVVRRPTPRSSSSYSRLTARVAWRRALQRQGVEAGLGRSPLILHVYAGDPQLSRGRRGEVSRAGGCQLLQPLGGGRGGSARRFAARSLLSGRGRGGGQDRAMRSEKPFAVRRARPGDAAAVLDCLLSAFEPYRALYTP